MDKRELNIAENWERVYDAFQQINFKAWDFITIKESLLDYLKLYYPENFNDFIESSELIAILELFAYIGELLSYRIDLNAHENFLSTAERKESVLRLAKFLSYNPSRNIPARGLVKITTVRTTERLVDSNGIDITNKTIRWNDPNNPNWKEQFTLVLNCVLEQNFGTVVPTDRVQVQNVLFELYTLKNLPIPTNTIPYNVSVADTSIPMELVSAEITSYGPREKRPENNQRINILYLRDGLGDSSDNTGFFFFTKSGTLHRKKLHFDGVLPNQTEVIKVDHINDTDVWLNQIVPETGEILRSGEELYGEPKVGEWQQVDIAHSHNILFNTLKYRNKYEVETLDNDNIRLIFGDGNFSSIPGGIFDLWYRVTEPVLVGQTTSIPRNAIQNESGAVTYIGASGSVDTFAFTFTLYDSIQNSAPSEALERIKEVAPSVYYSQDRMVNGKDYNEFMLQDNSILKLRAVNRTFSGDSKYIAWHDPKSYYENVKLFGDDLSIYFDTSIKATTILPEQLPPEDGGLNVPIISTLIDNYLQPLLENENVRNSLILHGASPENIKNSFTTSERVNISNGILAAINASPNTLYLLYNVNNNQEDNVWTTHFASPPQQWTLSVESRTDNSWVVSYRSNELTAHSGEVKFVVNNNGRRVYTYDTLRGNYDELTVLKANINSDGNVLDKNHRFLIVGGKSIDVGLHTGLCNYSEVSILPYGTNIHGLPDNADLDYLIPIDSRIYFHREDENSPWKIVEYFPDIEIYILDEPSLWKAERGVSGINFLWMHRTPRYHLIDPSMTNIIDTFLITRGYYSDFRKWLNGHRATQPTPPSSYSLSGDYARLLGNKMISDTNILHSGKFKLLFGHRAEESLQATLKVIKAANSATSNNQIKAQIVNIVKDFFHIDNWQFGQPFYYTELAARIHSYMSGDIESVVLVPKSATHAFGSMFEVLCHESEILHVDISVDDIEIVESLDPRTLKQRL